MRTNGQSFRTAVSQSMLRLRSSRAFIRVGPNSSELCLTLTISENLFTRKLEIGHLETCSHCTLGTRGITRHILRLHENFTGGRNFIGTLLENGSTQERLVSLDVFRGMTIAGMVLVNNPGSWSAIYGPLKHAEWHGITPTDYVFPFFLFIVGVAIPMALSKRVADGITRDVYWKILTRAIKIFSLGLLMSMIPFFVFGETGLPQAAKLGIMLGFSATLFLYLAEKKKIAAIVGGISALTVLVLWIAGTEFVWYNFGTMRIPGVLQRIAVCYLIVSIIYLHTSWKQQALIGTGLLLIYWLLMSVVPVPACEITSIDSKACNLAAYLDRAILGVDHMWRGGKVFDPEGILSTIPAIVTTISGVLTGTWLLRSERPASASAELVTGELPLANMSGLHHKGFGPFFVGRSSRHRLSWTLYSL